jgi:hypothetical protein
MAQTVEEKNKALVLEAFETLFNKRDLAGAERFWSSGYIQHSAHVPPGRDGLFKYTRARPPSGRFGIHIRDDVLTPDGKIACTMLPPIVPRLRV